MLHKYICSSLSNLQYYQTVEILNVSKGFHFVFYDNQNQVLQHTYHDDNHSIHFSLTVLPLVAEKVLQSKTALVVLFIGNLMNKYGAIMLIRGLAKQLSCHFLKCFYYSNFLFSIGYFSKKSCVKTKSFSYFYSTKLSANRKYPIICKCLSTNVQFPANSTTIDTNTSYSWEIFCTSSFRAGTA